MTNEEDDIVRDKASNDERSVEVLVKTRAVLDALAQLGPSNIKTISSYVGESSSSMYRLLANLVALGWVEHAANTGWGSPACASAGRSNRGWVCRTWRA